MDNPNSITVDAVKLYQLKAAYRQARLDKVEFFKFQELDFHTGYAGYFLEYHCPRFGVAFNRNDYN